MQRIAFTLKGDSALLMHNGESMSSLPGAKPADWPPRQKWIPTPEVEAEHSTYRFPDGALGIPSMNLYKCVVTAAMDFGAQDASGRQIARKNASSFVASALAPDAPMFELLDDDGVPIPTYAIDARRAVVQGQAVIRARARIDLPWTLECVYFWEPLLPPEHFRQIVDHAGKVVGICDFNPRHKGPFGKFRCSAMVVIDE